MMSKTILANTDGFTPIIDGLVKELGLMPAVVFGRMWRFCQMQDGVCKATLEKIAEGIGVDRATVSRHAKALCDAGYLKDLTPDLRNKPHVYADTGKAGMKVSISGVAQSNVDESDVAESHTDVAISAGDIAQSNTHVAESHLNKVLKKEVKETQKEKIIRILQSVSFSVFKDPREWEPVKRRLEQPDIVMTGENLRDVTDPANPMLITISGLSRLWKRGPFNEATAYESMYHKSFANMGLELIFQE